MKIALCQINTTVGAFNFNRDKILHYYSKAIKLNAENVVFQELTIHGYTNQDLLLENGFVDNNLIILY